MNSIDFLVVFDKIHYLYYFDSSSKKEVLICFPRTF